MISRAESLARKTRCQHCYAMIVPTAVEGRWMGLDKADEAVGQACENGVWSVLHKPMLGGQAKEPAR